jgi:hypothetical protein
MDCRFFHGSLSQGDRDFLARLLGKYSPELMMSSWVKRRQTRIPGGTRQDSDKARAANFLRRKGFCMKEHVHVYAVDVGCVFYEPACKE